MGLKNKIFEIFFSKFSLEGPPGASKVLSKNSNMGVLISLGWSYCCILKVLEIRVLEVKKSPKKDGKWLSYCNFNFAKSDI